MVVGSYPAFSPLPENGITAEKARRLFSVTISKDYSLLCFPQSGALPCPDFPHRRSGAADRPAIVLSGCKGTKKKLNLRR